jgi:hypothetical protein
VVGKPTTPEEVKVLHKLLRSDPDRYLQIVNGWIADNPTNSHAYFDRHFAWMELGEPQRAIADLDMVIQLDPKPVASGRAAKFTAASANTRKPWRILIALRPSILRNGQRTLSACLSKPIVMPG